jgi:tetraacyldisaccharide 4'-kinase
MPEVTGFEGWLTSRWYREAPPPPWLLPLSFAFGAVLAVRRHLYRSGLLRVNRLPVPVVVVGNLSVGGTGKTPLTAWLVQRLVDAGAQPGIASRGYGAAPSRGVVVVDLDSDPARVGDEPLLLRRLTGVPVCVAADRSAAARRLVQEGCDLVVCDDGLQHLALGRDIELAVIDGRRGLGNGALLPAGPLRDPKSRLASVDAAIVNGGDGDIEGLAIAPRVLRMQLEAGDLQSLSGAGTRPVDWLQGRDVHAVTGIGNPQRFFAQLRGLGARVREHAFPDHHAFVAADVRFDDDLPVLMTAKDAVKCAPLADARHWCVPVVARLPADQEQWLLERILALPRPPRRSRS